MGVGAWLDQDPLVSRNFLRCFFSSQQHTCSPTLCIEHVAAAEGRPKESERVRVKRELELYPCSKDQKCLRTLKQANHGSEDECLSGR